MNNVKPTCVWKLNNLPSNGPLSPKNQKSWVTEDASVFRSPSITRRYKNWSVKYCFNHELERFPRIEISGVKIFCYVQLIDCDHLLSNKDQNCVLIFRKIEANSYKRNNFHLSIKKVYINKLNIFDLLPWKWHWMYFILLILLGT